jgi:hypothetical protein
MEMGELRLKIPEEFEDKIKELPGMEERVSIDLYETGCRCK